MAKSFSSIDDVLRADYDTIIDVRAPCEFAQDHLPGAINLPVLDDAERIRVGTIYKQESPFLARKIGAALVARNTAKHIEERLGEYDGKWRPLVYCWRGGQRSNAFATVLTQIGWRVDVIEGGYRSWRRLVNGALHDTELAHRFVLLDGFTGTAKTDLIHRVAARGGQVLDLEGIARHRGSIFGTLGLQPPQKTFESDLAVALAKLDPARPVLVEAESSRIGDRSVPASVWKQMCAAPRINVTAPLSSRARYLSEAYSDLVVDAHELERMLQKLVPLQGYERVDMWSEMARTGEFVELAGALMAFHYDPRYAKSRARHDADIAATLDLCDLGVPARDDAAGQIMLLMEAL
ncbi:tRNA 2-selenouridine(34) synthase MnmH [Celeribacter arenosi]|uniref:tRNA 2-selenouridine(34) synthase MnmH n=1 Tax=Celeribacter arenosi TaxID=792649 RepID=A0ABP7KDH1_9RHOB